MRSSGGHLGGTVRRLGLVLALGTVLAAAEDFRARPPPKSSRARCRRGCRRRRRRSGSSPSRSRDRAAAGARSGDAAEAGRDEPQPARETLRRAIARREARPRRGRPARVGVVHAPAGARRPRRLGARRRDEHAAALPHGRPRPRRAPLLLPRRPGDRVPRPEGRPDGGRAGDPPDRRRRRAARLRRAGRQPHGAGHLASAAEGHRRRAAAADPRRAPRTPLSPLPAPARAARVLVRARARPRRARTTRPSPTTREPAHPRRPDAARGRDDTIELRR